MSTNWPAASNRPSISRRLKPLSMTGGSPVRRGLPGRVGTPRNPSSKPGIALPQGSGLHRPPRYLIVPIGIAYPAHVRILPRMRWVAKAAVQRGLGVLPQGERLNYVFQRRVLHSFPVGDSAYRQKFTRATAHLAAYEGHCPGVPSADATFYEFGAGWDL